MSVRIFQTRKGSRLFRIEGQYPLIGSYLYIFDIGNPICTHDYLQDNNVMCMRCANEDFGVPLDSWAELSDTSERYTEVERPMTWNEIENI